MENILKNLFDLNEDGALHVASHRATKFGIYSFLVQHEIQLMRNDHAEVKGAVLRLKNHGLGLPKKLRDFKIHLVLGDSTLCVNFDCTSITNDEFEQLRLRNSR